MPKGKNPFELVPIEQKSDYKVAQNSDKSPEINVKKDYVSVNSIIYKVNKGKEESEIEFSYFKQKEPLLPEHNKRFSIKIKFLFNRPIYSEVSEPGKHIKLLADGLEIKSPIVCSQSQIDTFIKAGLSFNDICLPKWMFSSRTYYFDPSVSIGARMARNFDRALGTQIERKMTTELSSKNGMEEEEFINYIELEELKTLVSAQKVEIQIFNDKYTLPRQSLEKLRLFYIAAFKAVDTPFQSEPGRQSPFSN
jgi:hypothetical protein